MELAEIKHRMHSNQVYVSSDALGKEQAECLELLYDFNQTRPFEYDKRLSLLKQLFAEIGEHCYVEPPLRANWGKHTHIGKHFYANFNLTLVDDTHIYIGDYVLIGPNVTIATASHPIDPKPRALGAQSNHSVRIGNNVWIGAHCVILPGISIGDNTVIGAGSIVTKDVPSNVVAVGNPCRIMRPITEADYLSNRDEF